MIKWIGIEKQLWQLEEEKNNLESLRKLLQGEDVDVFVMGDTVECVSDEVQGCEKWVVEAETERMTTNMTEGVLIVAEGGCCPSLQPWIGKLPVVGYMLPGKSGFDGRIKYVTDSFEGVDMAYLQQVYHRFWHLPMEIVSAKRWLLREVMPEDVSHLWKNDVTFLSHGAWTTEREAETFVKAYIKNMYEFYQYGMWILCKPNEALENGLLGIAGVDNIDENDLSEDSRIRQELTEVYCLQAGYHITKENRRKGYALEALCAIVRYAFEQLGVEKLVLFIEPSNLPSLNLAQKAGFIRYERTLYQGRSVDVYVRTGGNCDAENINSGR